MFRVRVARVNRQQLEARHRRNVRRLGHREPSCGRPVAQPRMWSECAVPGRPRELRHAGAFSAGRRRDL